MVAADLSGESAEGGDGNPQRALLADPKARHPGDVLWVSQSLETSDNLMVGHECRPQGSRVAGSQVRRTFRGPGIHRNLIGAWHRGIDGSANFGLNLYPVGVRSRNS